MSDLEEKVNSIVKNYKMRRKVGNYIEYEMAIVRNIVMYYEKTLYSIDKRMYMISAITDCRKTHGSRKREDVPTPIYHALVFRELTKWKTKYDNLRSSIGITVQGDNDDEHNGRLVDYLRYSYKNMRELCIHDNSCTIAEIVKLMERVNNYSPFPTDYYPACDSDTYWVEYIADITNTHMRAYHIYVLHLTREDVDSISQWWEEEKNGILTKLVNLYEEKTKNG